GVVAGRSRAIGLVHVADHHPVVLGERLGLLGDGVDQRGGGAVLEARPAVVAAAAEVGDGGNAGVVERDAGVHADVAVRRRGADHGGTIDGHRRGPLRGRTTVARGELEIAVVHVVVGDVEIAGGAGRDRGV